MAHALCCRASVNHIGLLPWLQMLGAMLGYFMEIAAPLSANREATLILFGALGYLKAHRHQPSPIAIPKQKFPLQEKTPRK
jgi:hypothetical protein